jgi:hypothetical protein
VIWIQIKTRIKLQTLLLTLPFSLIFLANNCYDYDLDCLGAVGRDFGIGGGPGGFNGGLGGFNGGFNGGYPPAGGYPPPGKLPDLMTLPSFLCL